MSSIRSLVVYLRASQINRYTVPRARHSISPFSLPRSGTYYAMTCSNESNTNAWECGSACRMWMVLSSFIEWLLTPPWQRLGAIILWPSVGSYMLVMGPVKEGTRTTRHWNQRCSRRTLFPFSLMSSVHVYTTTLRHGWKRENAGFFMSHNVQQNKETHQQDGNDTRK